MVLLSVKGVRISICMIVLLKCVMWEVNLSLLSFVKHKEVEASKCFFLTGNAMVQVEDNMVLKLDK